MAQEYKAKLNIFTGTLQLVPTNIVLAFKPGVATQASLPLTGNAKGDARITNDTGNLYVWSIEDSSGTIDKWVDAGDIVDIDWSVITSKPSSSVANIDSAVSLKHTQNTDQYLDFGGASQVSASDVADAVVKKHDQLHTISDHTELRVVGNPIGGLDFTVGSGEYIRNFSLVTVSQTTLTLNEGNGTYYIYLGDDDLIHFNKGSFPGGLDYKLYSVIVSGGAIISYEEQRTWLLLDRHTQGTDQKIDDGGVSETTAAEIRDSADKKHDAVTAGDGIGVVGQQVSNSDKGSTAVDAHKDLTAGVHGVGAGIIAKVADIAVDGNLSAAAQDAITKKHTQGTDQGLDTGGANEVTAAQVKQAVSNKHIRFNIIDPRAVVVYQSSVICIIPSLDVGITIKNIKVTCELNPQTELDWSLEYADAFIGLTNPILITTLNTIAGIFNSGIISVSVAAGKSIYIVFNDTPAELPNEVCVDITYQENL